MIQAIFRRWLPKFRAVITLSFDTDIGQIHELYSFDSAVLKSGDRWYDCVNSVPSAGIDSEDQSENIHLHFADKKLAHILAANFKTSRAQGLG